MGDLIGQQGFLNRSAPFDPHEYNVLYKTERQYHDFQFGNSYNDTCQYPRFWNESGYRVLQGSDAVFDQLKGCYDSDFDQVCAVHADKDLSDLNYSMGTPKLLASFLIGSDNFRNSLRHRTDFASGYHRSAKSYNYLAV